MALSASLHLRQSQSLVMTPQLIQSIRLLQLTHMELNSYVEAEVEKNPLLEFIGDDDGGAGGGSSGQNGSGGEAGGTDRGEIAVADRAAEGHAGDTASPDWDVSGTTVEGESLAERLDASYENVYQDDVVAERAGSPEQLENWKSMPGANGAQPGEAYDLDEFVAGQRSLRDVVADQIALTFSSPADRLIAGDLADHLDDAGYLRAGVEETAVRLGADEGQVAAVLLRLQDFDPPGVFARSLAECLAIQLKARDRFDPAMQALVDHLDLLARRDFQSLRRICGVDEEDLLDMLSEIRALDPRPGMRFETGATETIVPDVIVRRASDGGWDIELTPDTLPRVLVNETYYAKVCSKGGARPEDQAFLNECLQNANWLTRSLDQRAKTIVKVASEIVRQQDGFLLHGVAHLRPLNLRAVADAIGMHESTVSRVTSNKYMMTPRGIFELKYFFTVSIAAVSGGEAHSAESVRQLIRQMIAEEAADSVLSDDDIVKKLGIMGIDIARRTVAKYREGMNLASSVQRRREKKALARRSGS
jgi:RNA polymerase sigma-54 factor